MIDNLNLANIQKRREQKEIEELSKEKMKNIAAGDDEMEKECCLMFCEVTHDSTGELLFFVI